MTRKFAGPCLALGLAFLTSCAALNPFRPGLDSFDSGVALFNQGNFAAAIPYFEDATRENPEFAQAYLYLGRAYLSQSKWRAAIQPLRTAFRLAPRDARGEISNLLIDALFAAALNDLPLGDWTAAPLRPL